MIFVAHCPNIDAVVRLDYTPTSWNNPHGANYYTGPFQTIRWAKFLVHHGRGNPHCLCVDHAERLGREYAADARHLPEFKYR